MVSNASLERSGDQTNDEDEDDGSPRIIITLDGPGVMNREMEQDFKAALEQEMRALMVRERSNHNKYDRSQRPSGYFYALLKAVAF